MKRKAISDIMALVIIIGIVISIASMMTYWSKNYAKDITGDVSQASDKELICMSEFIDVSDIFLNTSSDTLEFTVDNKGASQVTLSSATAYNLSGYNCTIPVSGTSIPSGGIAIFNASACAIYSSCTSFHYLEITTTCSTSAVKDSLESSQCS